MLLGNYSVLNKSAGRKLGGSTVSDTRPNYGGNSRMNQYLGGFAAFNGTPVGYRPPYCFVLPLSSGGLAASNTVTGDGLVGFANLAGGLSGEAALSGSGDITNAAIEWLIQATAALAGSGDLSASVTGKLEAFAALAGSGDITGTLNAVMEIFADLAGSSSVAADITGKLEAVAALSGGGDLASAITGLVQAAAALSGSGTISNAEAVSIWNMVAGLTGSGDITVNLSAIAHLAAVLAGLGALVGSATANGEMAAEIVVTGDLLSSANVGAAVWAALATTNNTPGSMGEKMNAAGSAGDPWTTALPGSYAAGTAGDIIGNMTSAPTVAQIWQHAIEAGVTAEELMRMIVSLSAAKATGGGTSTIEFKSLDGTKTRLQLNITDADGNRNNPTIVDLS